MRITVATAVALGLFSMTGPGCADAGEGVAINRGALGGSPTDDATGPRFIVKYRDTRAGAAALHAAGAKVVLDLPDFQAAAAHIPEQALTGLSHNPNIEYIEADQIRRPLAEQIPYGIPMVQGQPSQLAEATGTAKVSVCIIDSGYSTSHEDLGSGNVSGYTDPGTGDWRQDEVGHGTHVAGTIRALKNTTGVVGVNPSGNLPLYIVKVFTNAGWTYSSTLADALGKCRNYLAARKTQTGDASLKLVVSMSLGGSGKSRFEDQAFAAAYSAGVLSIAAAGNDGNTATSYPAGYASVMSVAAIDANKLVADFSQKNADVEIAAPGVGVLSTVPWTATASISANGTTINGHTVEFSAQDSVTGTLVDGGICDTVGSWNGKVVLCARGTIAFVDKVMNAQSGGAAGVVIYNNVAGDIIATLSDGNTSEIPAITVTQAEGASLVALAGHSATLVSQVDYTTGSYEAWDGTSMATPHVAGVAALVWNLMPNRTNAQVRGALIGTAQDLGDAGRDNSYGYGLVQAGPALGRLACTIGQTGASCSSNAGCCSNVCSGRPNKKTCQ